MLLRLTQSKSTLSSFMLGLFCLLIIIGSLFSIFFQAPLATNHELTRLRLLFEPDELQKIRSFTLTNRLGTFTFERIGDESQWRMIEPRSVMANPLPIERLFETLSEVRIRRIYDKDPINRSNYSLDNPQIRINLLYQDLSTKELMLGLVNPVDNSTYVKFAKGDLIYHVDALAHTLESLDLVNFIDTRVFSVPVNSIASVRISREANFNNPHLSIRLQEGQWIDSNERQIDSEEVHNFLNQLTSLRSIFIIDKTTEDLQRAIDQQLQRPAFFIEMTSTEGELYSYQVSQTVNSLPDIKTEKRQTFLVQASHRDYPFLLPRENLDLFSRRNNQFAAMAIKKLFY